MQDRRTFTTVLSSKLTRNVGCKVDLRALTVQTFQSILGVLTLQPQSLDRPFSTCTGMSETVGTYLDPASYSLGTSDLGCAQAVCPLLEHLWPWAEAGLGTLHSWRVGCLVLHLFSGLNKLESNLWVLPFVVPSPGGHLCVAGTVLWRSFLEN